MALLWHLLKLAGAEVSYYVPHRIEEGYGLNSEALAVISEQGAELVVTVDCGITSVDEAKVAREKGITLVITDHHQPKAELPQVAAIVHPTVEDGYPNGDLCGAGVAFKTGVDGGSEAIWFRSCFAPVQGVSDQRAAAGRTGDYCGCCSTYERESGHSSSRFWHCCHRLLCPVCVRCCRWPVCLILPLTVRMWASRLRRD